MAPIHYGQDQCDYCRMTIADEHFSAQLVTHKGKNYKFDAIECMIWFLEEGRTDTSAVHTMKVADYSHPGEMLDAPQAVYLISPEIKSPMGANLAAFPDKTMAEGFRQKYGGRLYRWHALFPVVQKRKEELKMHHH